MASFRPGPREDGGVMQAATARSHCSDSKHRRPGVWCHCPQANAARYLDTPRFPWLPQLLLVSVDTSIALPLVAMGSLPLIVPTAQLATWLISMCGSQPWVGGCYRLGLVGALAKDGCRATRWDTLNPCGPPPGHRASLHTSPCAFLPLQQFRWPLALPWDPLTQQL